MEPAAFPDGLEEIKIAILDFEKGVVIGEPCPHSFRPMQIPKRATALAVDLFVFGVCLAKHHTEQLRKVHQQN
jgi:hypothetical protein